VHGRSSSEFFWLIGAIDRSIGFSFRIYRTLWIALRSIDFFIDICENFDRYQKNGV